MTRKREAILLLLGSCRDFDPALGVNFRPTRGLVAAERRPCPDCGHTEHPGERVDSFKRRTPCVTCGGSPEPTGAHGQWLTRDRGTGYVMVDPMDADNAPVRSEAQAAPPTKPVRMVTCDGCDGAGTRAFRRCAVCDGAGQVRAVNLKPLELDDRQAEPTDSTTAAIVKRDAAGDYHALDYALGKLRPRHRRLVLAIHGPSPSRDRGTLPPGVQRHLEAALVCLEGWMPERPRVPGYVRQAAKRKTAPRGAMSSPHQLAQRDKDIRRLVRQGRPRQWVAAEYGLSVSRLSRIVNGESEAA